MTAVSPNIFPSDAVLDMEGGRGRSSEPGRLFIKVDPEKPQVAVIIDDVPPKSKMTIEEGLYPLLASMKLFGLYSSRPRSAAGDSQEKRSRKQTAYLVYAVAIVVVMWINALRMFSAFTHDDVFGLALLHKFSGIIWAVQCAIAQSAFCAASFSGRLATVFLQVMEDSCAGHARKFSAFFAVLSWTIVGLGAAFFAYGLFVTDGYMDNMLTPFQTHIPVSHPLFPRIVAWLLGSYQMSAFIFTQTTTLVLTMVFSTQFKKVIAALGQCLDNNKQRQVSDSDIEMLRQKHQQISMNVDHVDDCLMFSNASAFCSQVSSVIILLYSLVFYHSLMINAVFTTSYVFWLFVITVGLVMTAAGGITVHHYVSQLNVLLING